LIVNIVETAEYKQSMQKKHNSRRLQLFLFPPNDYPNEHLFTAVSSNGNLIFARLNKSPNPKFPSNYSSKRII
jgi:hypothetical protein